MFIEYVQDTAGFWRESKTNIKELNDCYTFT